MSGRFPVGIDASSPHPARMYDWYLGGNDNHPVDEAMGKQMPALDPRVPVMARVNRAFMHRSTGRLAEHGVRQFPDIGTGIPTEPNPHRIAQRVVPDASVVHRDNYPVVLAHVRPCCAVHPRGGPSICRPSYATRTPSSRAPNRCWTSAGPWRSP